MKRYVVMMLLIATSILEAGSAAAGYHTKGASSGFPDTASAYSNPWFAFNYQRVGNEVYGTTNMWAVGLDQPTTNTTVSAYATFGNDYSGSGGMCIDTYATLVALNNDGTWASQTGWTSRQTIGESYLGSLTLPTNGTAAVWFQLAGRITGWEGSCGNHSVAAGVRYSF